MTPKERAAVQQALEALGVGEEFVNRHSEDWYISGQKDLKQIREAITALREALAEPDIEEMTLTQIAARNEQAEQEPVAWAHPSGGYLSARYMKEFATGLEKETHIIPLYAAPVRTKDLTDDEIKKVWNKKREVFSFARAVIAADREKNK